jgi:hypothetical protein
MLTKNTGPDDIKETGHALRGEVAAAKLAWRTLSKERWGDRAGRSVSRALETAEKGPLSFDNEEPLECSLRR